MNIAILGIGCVNPLGRDWNTVRANLAAGRRPESVLLPGPPGHPAHPAYCVPAPFDFVHPRLRRSSAISHFACTAASAAVARSGPLPAGTTALVFAATDGAVVYTRRFYEEVVKSGCGSPLLFPETVYNAPASHVAAMFGIDGPVLTMVSDATAGTDALATAAELIRSGEAGRCLVVASEEADWILCDGSRRWGLSSTGSESRRRGLLSEGAVALVVGAASPGDIVLETVHRGLGIARNSSRRERLEKMFFELAGGTPPEAAVLSSSGAFGGNAEEAALVKLFPGIRLDAPNKLAGEAFAVSTLLQCAWAWQEIRDGRAGRVLVSALGWNGQAGGAVLTVSAREG
ncbi:MAG: beta-ketoacyl synthase N-terminal-like domain-containing protein [Verrucomicrobiae bacterium]